MSDSNKTTFFANFPAIQSAIKTGSDGMRIQLDIPESEMPHSAYLLNMRNVVLKVTIEVYDGFSDIHKDND